MKFKAALAVCLFVTTPLMLNGCQDRALTQHARATQKLPKSILAKMKAADMDQYSPIMVRIFKEENVLEVWKQKRDGKYGLIATYDICKWSGKLGPKYMEGDRQAPEGFYTVQPAQMNPNSHYYLSFDIGFPNAYDRVNGRTGRHLMVHGACSSSGCYSMSDANIAQIYAFGRDAFIGGQREFQIQAFPFRMTTANMERYRQDINYGFWSMLKRGYDLFEKTKIPPRVAVCERRYIFNPPAGVALQPDGSCPAGVADADLPSAYQSPGKSLSDVFQSVLTVTQKAPSPSITGTEEARLVADWSRRRAAGEVVSREPPSLSAASAEKPNAPDILPPMTIPAKPLDQTHTASVDNRQED